MIDSEIKYLGEYYAFWFNVGKVSMESFYLVRTFFCLFYWPTLKTYSVAGSDKHCHQVVPFYSASDSYVFSEKIAVQWVGTVGRMQFCYLSLEMQH